MVSAVPLTVVSINDDGSHMTKDQLTTVAGWIILLGFLVLFWAGIIKLVSGWF